MSFVSVDISADSGPGEWANANGKFLPVPNAANFRPPDFGVVIQSQKPYY